MNGHFEQGKWVEEPYYYPICYRRGRQEGDKWILDVLPEKGDSILHRNMWLVFDGMGWVFDRSKYAQD